MNRKNVLTKIWKPNGRILCQVDKHKLKPQIPLRYPRQIVVRQRGFLEEGRRRTYTNLFYD